MKVLVTGGAGFLGSHLVDRLLAEGHHVDVVDDLSSGSLAAMAEARRQAGRRLSFNQLDVRSDALGELMDRARPQVVFHLAGRRGAAASVADPVGDAEVNLLGSLRVLDATRACGAQKVVVVSPAADVYGPVERADLPVKESHPRRPTSPHGVAMNAVGEYLSAYRELHNLEFTSLLAGHVYGPGRRSGAVASFARCLLAGRAATIYGDGRQSGDFVFVDDVVDAVARAAERGGGLTVNVGTGRETTVAALYELVGASAAAGHPPAPVRAPARPADPARSCLDPGRAAIHLGWRPWTALEDGVDAVVDWWRSQPVDEDRG